jgi:hypothetical protein
MRTVWAVLMISIVLSAQPWVLIGHPGSEVKEMSAGEIRDIYLGKRHLIGTVRIIPLQLGAENPLRRQFESEILHMSRPALQAWWVRRHYLGQRPPRVVGSAEAVLAYVRQVKGAVGYVPESLAGEANVTALYYGGEPQP